jgi:hypothetical protein
VDGGVLGIGQIDGAGVVAARAVADRLGTEVFDTRGECGGVEARVAERGGGNAIEARAVHRTVVERLAGAVERDRVDADVEGIETEHDHVAAGRLDDVALRQERRVAVEETAARPRGDVVDDDRGRLSDRARLGDVDRAAVG